MVFCLQNQPYYWHIFFFFCSLKLNVRELFAYNLFREKILCKPKESIYSAALVLFLSQFFFPNSLSCFEEVLIYINFFSVLAPCFIQNTLLVFVATDVCNYSSVFTYFFCFNSMSSFNLNLLYTQLFTQCILK